MAENLKNTILIEDKEYNINAVHSDEAGKVTTPLVIKESLTAGIESGSYNGDATDSTKKEINYVPSDGGKFTGPVHIDNKHENYLGDVLPSEIINYGQINAVISQLTGAPLYTWEVEYDEDNYVDKHDYTVVKNTSGIPYKLNTVVGRTETLQFFKNYAEGKKNDKTYHDSSDLDYEEQQNQAIVAEINSVTSEIFIPGKYKDKPVRIGDSVFANKTDIEKVYISSGVIGIGQGTFEGCAALAHITIPDSITSIEGSVFEGCSSLTEIDLSRGLTEIPQAAFYDCTALKKITIGHKVTKICSSAFCGCNALTDIYFVGTETDWNNIEIINDHDIYDQKPGLISKLADKSITIHYGNMPFPFLYICKDGDSNTDLTSNKMFLKLPGKDVIEISKGAARLEKPDSQANYGYYTYDTLAAIIASINARLEGLGSTALKIPTTLPETGLTIIPEELRTEVLKDSFEPDSVATVQQLQEQITKITGGDYTDKKTFPKTFVEAYKSGYDFSSIGGEVNSGQVLTFGSVTSEKLPMGGGADFEIKFLNNTGAISGTILNNSGRISCTIRILNSGGTATSTVTVANGTQCVLPETFSTITEFLINYEPVDAEEFHKYVGISFSIEEDLDYSDTVLKAKADEDSINIKYGYYRTADKVVNTGIKGISNTISIVNTIPTSSTAGNIGDIMIVIN